MSNVIVRSILRLGFVLLILAIILYAIVKSPWMQKRVYPLRYEEDILRYSSEYDLDPYLVMSIIWVESKFEPKAASGKGACGLMQIIPSTGQWIAKEIGIDNYNDDKLFDPKININMGCWYLNYLLNVFEYDTHLALAAYNGGMGNVMKWLQDERYSKDGTTLYLIPFEETRQYVERVMNAYEHYKRLYEI